MRLLISVSSAEEASAALLGEADIIDAKDPLRGSLGAVTPEVFRNICKRVDGLRPVTAALGDASDEESLERLVLSFATAGAAYVKVGFAGVADSNRVRGLLAAATRGVRTCQQPSRPTGVIAVAYADPISAATLPPSALADIAAGARVSGVLLDTFDKGGPGLCELVSMATLGRWVADAHGAGMLAAVAGKLTTGDMVTARDAGADIAGIRGAACDGGRSGVVVPHKVRALRALCELAETRFG